MKKFLPLLLLLILGAVGVFLYLQTQQTTKLTTSNHLIWARTLVSTEGWKEYSTDTFTIKYPPNFIVNDERYINVYPNLKGLGNKVLTITEEVDQAIHEGGAYTPGAWTGVEIYSPVLFDCNYAEYSCSATDDLTRFLHFYPTDWKNELLLQTDARSPRESGTSFISLSGKKTVNTWFLYSSGGEGFPLSESNLYVRLFDKPADPYDPFKNLEILPVRGFAIGDAEKNLAIIETMYSTIVFHE